MGLGFILEQCENLLIEIVHRYNFKFFLGESQDLPLKSEDWNGKSDRLGSVQVKCTSTKSRTTVNRKLDKGRIIKDNDDYNEYGFNKNGSNTDGFDKDSFDKDDIENNGFDDNEYNFNEELPSKPQPLQKKGN